MKFKLKIKYGKNYNICYDSVIKSKNINTSTCKCKGTICNVHDDCLEIFLIKGKSSNFICKTCNSNFILSNNLKNRIELKSIQNPNFIVRDYLNRNITEDDILISKREIYKFRRNQIIMRFIIIGIICLLLYSKNNYMNIVGITLINIGRFRINKKLEWFNLLLFNNIVNFIEIFTFQSLDYVNFIYFIIIFSNIFLACLLSILIMKINQIFV